MFASGYIPPSLDSQLFPSPAYVILAPLPSPLFHFSRTNPQQSHSHYPWYADSKIWDAIFLHTLDTTPQGEFTLKPLHLWV